MTALGQTVWAVENHGGGEYLGTDSIWSTEEAASARADEITIGGYYRASVVKCRLNAPEAYGL